MKKYIQWTVIAVAMVAVMITAVFLYDKFSAKYQPDDGGVEALPPWDGGSWGEPSTSSEESIQNDTDPPTEPSQSETEPANPSQAETEPSEPSQSETYPNEPSQSESEPVEPSVSESEPKDPPESEPSEPSQSETPPPEETTPRESETTSPPQTEPETPKVDEPPARPTLKAPDFTVLDMNGNKVKLSDYTGKPIVVNYWATWCGYCMIEMPDFENMYKKYGDRVNFLMVNAGDDSLKDVQQYASKSGYSFPMFFDSTGEAANAYSAYAYPTTYFFYADGNPGYRKVGVISAEALEDTILKLLNY